MDTIRAIEVAADTLGLLAAQPDVPKIAYSWDDVADALSTLADLRTVLIEREAERKLRAVRPSWAS